MYAIDEAAVEAATSKIHRYDIQIIGSTRVPVNEEGEPIPQAAPSSFSGTPKKLSKNLVRLIVLAMRQLLKAFIVTDGVNTIYSIGDLGPVIKKYITSDPNSKVTEALEKLSLASEKGAETLVFNVDRGAKRYAIQLKRVKWDQGDKLEKAQMLQVAVQYSFFAFATDNNKNFHLTARSMFTDDRKQPFGDNSDLMLYSGIFQSFRYNAANKPMVNIDVAHFPALRNDVSLLQYMQMQANGKLSENMKKQDFVKFLTELINGKLVRARYGGSVTYRLEGFDTTFTPTTAKFEFTEKKKAARVISVLEYMQGIKKLKVSAPDQPLILAKIPPREDEKAKEGGGEGKEGSSGGAGGGGGGGRGRNSSGRRA